MSTIVRGYKTELKLNNAQRTACLFPRFKSKKRGIGSFRLTGAIHIGENWIQLPRLGRLRLKERGYLPLKDVKILSVTVSEQAGKWFVSVQVEEEPPKGARQVEPRIAFGDTIGVDLGVKTLATLSDGRVIANSKPLGSHLGQLKRLSRQHARKQKGSKNRHKAARKLARLHAHIANIRKDTLHKVTSLIVAKTKPDHERPTCIVLEDLHIRGMVKNRKLARAISDVGFFEFRRLLEYKAQEAGSLIYRVSRWEPSSKTCSWCAWIDEDLTLADRLFHCEECGYEIERDLNAAINLALKAAG